MTTKKEIAVRNDTYSITNPQEVSALAMAVKKHIVQNKLSVNIVGKEYAMVEGWQFAGGMLGLFPQIVKVENLSSGAEYKWMATVNLVNLKTKEVVGTGFALCSNKEGKKKTFDEYAVLSMAQTRAIGKAYRNFIGWIMKMAGYDTTPAEEIKNIAGQPVITQPVKESKVATAPGKPVDYISQVKIRLGKIGAKNEAQGIKILRERTGLTWKNFNVTPKQAQIALAALIQSK